MGIFIEIFEKNDDEFNSVLVLDLWESLRIEKNWYEPSKFTLVLAETIKHVRYCVPDNCLLIDDTYYFVDSVKGAEDKLTVTGYSLAKKLDTRIIKGSYNRNAKPEIIAHDLIKQYAEDVRCLTIGAEPSFNGSAIRYQNSYEEVLNAVGKLCETYDFGYTEKALNFSKPYLMINIEKGKDLSNNVEFSADFENLLNEEYENSKADEKTTAYVYGEGEGQNRIFEIVNSANKGLERKELYVDAKDLKKEIEEDRFLTDKEYRALLRQRGEQELAEFQPILSLVGTIQGDDKLFRLGYDYNLGDIVTIRSSKYNLKRAVRITSIQQTWDSEGYHIDPVFGVESPTIIDKLERRFT